MLFRHRTWCKARVLPVRAILTPGQRTVAAALRAMGLSGDLNYARYHHVLNRAAWSPTRKYGLNLGVKTQRQWSDLAITRTTPVLMGLFSCITLAAHRLQQESPIVQCTAAWYAKPAPTFVDAIALVRPHLWLASEGFSMSVSDDDREKPVPDLHSQLIDSLACAA